ncbi:ribosomal-protein-serine acetyltransferase [Oceaniferula spumae]|uniref:Ribosomal-protein-serine acetyltransferase n=1 Tax=Oceaniferula spumae TaxID=2979115 RepID=A0AAT9FPQ7_9BACT
MKLPINENFHLRLTNPDDAEETFAVVDRNREYLRQWMPWVDGVQSSDAIRQHLDSLQAGIHDCPEFVLVYHGKIVGRLGFHRIDEQNRNTSVGYWLDAGQQGQGLMTMAVKAAVDYAIHTRKLHRVVLMAAVDNLASRAIPERLGFQQEGIARDGERLYDHFVDLAVYSILEPEWSARSAE